MAPLSIKKNIPDLPIRVPYQYVYLYALQKGKCNHVCVYSAMYLFQSQGLGASEKKRKKNYIILQGGELPCFHFFKSSC